MNKPRDVHAKLIQIGIIIAAVVLVCVVFAIIKPSMSALADSITPELITGAGDKYSETKLDYFAFNIARGKNIKTGAEETYLGVAGRIICTSKTYIGADGKMAGDDGGALNSLCDVLFWLPQLIEGTKITISLTIASVLIGLLMSVFLALGKISKYKLLGKLCGAYIFFFRGTPLLMQLFFIYYGLPQISPAFTINNKFLAAFIAFALNSAAYCAEIIRAAIQSIEKGQFEASRALGLTYGQTMRLIIIPQSIRRLIPPVANEFIMVLKDASLVSIIALADLTHTTRSISSSANSVLVFIPAMIIYLIITAVFSLVFNKLEKKFSIYQ